MGIQISVDGASDTISPQRLPDIQQASEFEPGKPQILIHRSVSALP